MQAQILGLEVRDLQPSISKVRSTGLEPPTDPPSLTRTNFNTSAFLESETDFPVV